MRGLGGLAFSRLRRKLADLRDDESEHSEDDEEIHAASRVLFFRGMSLGGRGRHESGRHTIRYSA